MANLKVGFARVDITPEQYGPMGGHGNDAHRICTQVLDRIYGSVIAITDEKGETVLFCPCDIIHAKRTVADPTREAISAATVTSSPNSVTQEASSCSLRPSVPAD